MKITTKVVATRDEITRVEFNPNSNKVDIVVGDDTICYIYFKDRELSLITKTTSNVRIERK